jgi:hypothetical protein
MNFCYIDESGTGSEPYAVMSGIIVDAQRMQVTKDDWLDLLAILSDLIKKPVEEIHTRDFYPGNGIWRDLDGSVRSQVITAVFGWLNNRKHSVICSVIDKTEYQKHRSEQTIPDGINTIWKCLGLHLILSLQKAFQTKGKNKGNTLLVFDEEKREELRFANLINSPPGWTDEYYGRKRKHKRLNQIIDVPYFADSKHVGLIQLADFAAFFLRRFVEIKTGAVGPRYEEEEQKIDEWIASLCQRRVQTSASYPKRGRNAAQDFFWSIAPDCIRTM